MHAFAASMHAPVHTPCTNLPTHVCTQLPTSRWPRNLRCLQDEQVALAGLKERHAFLLGTLHPAFSVGPWATKQQPGLHAASIYRSCSGPPVHFTSPCAGCRHLCCVTKPAVTLPSGCHPPCLPFPLMQAQKTVWQRGLEARILLQRALAGANRLPQVGTARSMLGCTAAVLSPAWRGAAEHAVLGMEPAFLSCLARCQYAWAAAMPGL